MWWPKIRLAALLWLLPGLCVAQGAGPSPREEAVQYYQASERLYAQGDYAGALSYLEEAYRLQPSPTLLYNMARAREKLDRLPEALATYEAYLSEAPNADNREQVQMRISTLRKEIDERERLRREREAAAAAAGGTAASGGGGASGWQSSNGGSGDGQADEGGGGPGPWPWVLAGVGAASLVTAGALFAMANKRHDEAVDATAQLDAYDLQTSAEALATGSTVATVAGVLLLGVGGVWGVMSLVGRSGASEDDQEAAFEPLLGPAAAGFRGRF
jgi:tetratricopeptide (TPR) repeat protein